MEGYGTAVQATTDILDACIGRDSLHFRDNKMTQLRWDEGLFRPLLTLPNPFRRLVYETALATAQWQLDYLGRAAGLVS